MYFNKMSQLYTIFNPMAYDSYLNLSDSDLVYSKHKSADKENNLGKVQRSSIHMQLR